MQNLNIYALIEAALSNNNTVDHETFVQHVFGNDTAAVAEFENTRFDYEVNAKLQALSKHIGVWKWDDESEVYTLNINLTAAKFFVDLLHSAYNGANYDTYEVEYAAQTIVDIMQANNTLDDVMNAIMMHGVSETRDMACEYMEQYFS